jgi:general secretion pathway protein B
MSYILDALRKSEQERQVASGHGVGMLYPVSQEHKSGISRKTILLGALALIITISLNWWSWSRVSQPAKPPLTGNVAPVPGAPANPALAATPAVSATVPATSPVPLAATVAVVPPKPEPAAQPQPRPTGAMPTAVASLPSPERKPTVSIAPAPDKSARKASAETFPAPSIAVVPKSEPSAEAPKGMPTISISGYIKDETGGNLAIINDKLVREGDEVSPGLRLEKIDGENAFFNYKGQRFRR